MKTFFLNSSTARHNCAAYLNRCPDGFQVDIHEAKVKRTSRANRRHWAIMRQISEEAWIEGRQYSQEVWHDFFCRRFLGVIDLPGGASMAESSASLRTDEFCLFDQKIEAYMGQELGLIPIEPMEQLGRPA